jgi:acyl-CoA synthetase (AMP-forming)/AMP-acid ligase II
MELDAAMSELAVAATIPGVVMETARRRPDHLAIVDARNRLTYGQVAARMTDFAAALVAAGLNKGESVGIWLPNSAEWVIAAMGVHAAGGVIVPLNTRYKGAEVAHALGSSRARFLIHADRFLGIDYGAILDGVELPQLERRIAVDLEGSDSGELASLIAQGAADAVAGAEVESRLAALSADDVSDIIFTSGTTGAPKGVVTGHGQNVRTYVEWVRATTLGPDDRYLLIWPMSHCSGYKSGWLAGAIAGATVYPEATLDIDRLIERTMAERITFLPGPPPLFQSLLRVAHKQKAGLTSLRVVGTGGTAIDPAMIEAVRAELGAEVVYAGYGLTESCGTITMIRPEDSHDMVVKSSGRAIDGVELAAMGPDGAILPTGDEGELVTRGFHVMQGYLDDPEATAAAIDGQGWLRTGDLGRLDERGFVYITGRAKDMYIVGGFNCYPAEIENAIQPHPGVREIAVIGVPDERMGEIGLAFIVREPDTAVSEEALIEWCREQMANYKIPRHIRFVDALPRNAMGKVEKFKLEKDC